MSTWFRTTKFEMLTPGRRQLRNGMPLAAGLATRPVTKYVANYIVTTYWTRNFATDLGMSRVRSSRIFLFVIG